MINERDKFGGLHTNLRARASQASEAKLVKRALILACVLPVFATAQAADTSDLQAQVEKSNTINIAQTNLTPEVKYPQLATLLEYNNFPEADKQLKEILSKNPNDPEALSLKAVSLAKQYKLTAAQAQIDSLMKKYPDNANLHYAQGVIHLNRLTSSDAKYIKDSQNLINSAIKEFVNAIELDNNYYAAYNAMGVASLRLGNVEDAEELFQAALKIKPDYATVLDNIGAINLADNNLAAAEENFKTSMKYNSRNPSAMYHMAQVETRRGNYSEALTWLNHSLYIVPNSSGSLNLQGELYLKQGNEAAAINSFKKAVQVKPENSQPYMNLAGVYENREDEEFAIEQLKTALAVRPQYQEGKLKVADMSYRTKKYDQAIKYYAQLIDDKEYSNQAISGLADTYYEMSRSKALSDQKELYLAYDYVNKAIEKSPDNLKLHLAKIKLASLTRQSAPSKESLNYIIQTAGDNLIDAITKGEAYLALGRDADAAYAFENAINFSNSLDDDLYLAEILVHEKQYPAARNALNKALMRDTNNQIAQNGIAYINLCESKATRYFLMAQSAYESKNYYAAIDNASRAADLYQNTPAIAKLKAQSYEKIKDRCNAALFYTQYLALCPNATDKNAIQKKIDKLSK